MNIGEKLKEARIEKDLTLAKIQEKTKIRSKYLRALENNDFDLIPGHVYVKAFIKEYARQVGLDPEELAGEYQKIINIKRARAASKEQQENERRFSGFNRNILIIIGIIGVIIILFVSIFIFTGGKNKEQPPETEGINNTEAVESEYNENIDTENGGKGEEEITGNEDAEDRVAGENEIVDSEAAEDREGVEDSENLAGNVNGAVNKEFPEKIENNEQQKPGDNLDNSEEDTDNVNNNEDADTAKNTSSGGEITLIAVDNTWIRVVVDGEEVFQGFMDRGDTGKYSADENIKIKIGNAAGLKIEYNGEIEGPFGEQGEVVEREINLKD